MTREELNNVLELHNKWVNNKVGERADLSGANFIGADLSKAYLSRANLIGANFIGADLSRGYGLNYKRIRL